MDSVLMIARHIRTAVPRGSAMLLEMVTLPMDEQRTGLSLGLAALHGGITLIVSRSQLGIC